MNNEVNFMLKKIVFFNVIIGTLITIITYFFIGNYAFTFLLGLFIAIINLYINGVVTNYSLNEVVCNSLLISFGLAIRVLLVCLVAILIIKIDRYKFVPYALGYSSQFIGLIIYGVTINNG